MPGHFRELQHAETLLEHRGFQRRRPGPPLCESASENALMDPVETGTVRMIGMADFTRTLGEVRPSIGPWMETARNVALYANTTGECDELARWLRKQR